MSDKLESVLVDAIQKTQAGIGEAVDFAITQAPDVIQQLLLWKTIQSLAIFIPLVLIALAFLGWIVWAVKKEKDYSEGYAFLTMGFFVFSALACNQLTWLKIWIAPKLYLVEYAASLVK
jgi:Na+-transporting NADH:ubiquinone oxidoreductase subunit NqrE